MTISRVLIPPILVGSLLFLSCGRSRVTIEEVDDQIRRELPKGSSSDRAIEFLNSFEINGLKVEHTGYIPLKPEGTDRVVTDKEVGGYIVGTIRRVRRTLTQAFHMRIVLYFDTAGRLIDKRIQEFGDW